MNVAAKLFWRKLKAVSGLGDAKPPSPSSYGFVRVAEEEINVGLLDSWKDPFVPKRQYESITRQELERYRAGKSVEPFDVLVNIIKDSIPQETIHSILEIGCSTGYYSEVLRIKGIGAEYHGCDYSEAFIRYARTLFPNIDFQVQDACNLTYQSGQFDLAVSGCCLLHIMDYEKAIKETARVTNKYAIFHRTPIIHTQATSYYLKTAYGVEMFEIHFNEREFLSHLRGNGLTVSDVITFNIGKEPESSDLFACKTYLCKKT
jgi:SAM-dependent methyltransferase